MAGYFTLLLCHILAIDLLIIPMRTAEYKFLLIVDTMIPIITLALYSLISIISNSSIYAGNQYVYIGKHIALIIAALFSIFHFNRVKKKEIFLYLFFFSFFFSYVISEGSHFVALQVCVFFLATRYLSLSFDRIADNTNLAIFFLFMLLIPLFFDVLFNNGNFVYTYFYGRGRLQLGFYHPKEAGNTILVIMAVVWAGVVFNKSILIKVTFILLLCVLLYFVQSRNALLFLFNVVFFTFLINFTSIGIALVTFVISYIGIPIIILQLYWEELNVVTSGRLGLWQGYLAKGDFINKEFLMQDGLVALNLDNFYLSFFIQNGPVALILMVVLLFLLLLICSRLFFCGLSITAILLALYVNSFFDAGLISTGSLLQVSIWSLVFYCLRRGGGTKQFYFKNSPVKTAC